MKKLATIIFCFSCVICFGTTIPIGPRQSIKTISQGIIRANSGDTLIVHPGTYREGNIILEKSISIVGKGLPVLDGENKYEILTIHANNVTISGLKFMNVGVASINDLAAIKVLESHYLHISNNKFENAFFGIYFANSSNCWVEGNQLISDAEAEHQIGNGIHLWKCENMTIHNNNVKGHRDGIYFEFVTKSLITDNYSEGN
ncbi:MAG TPA: NosD domain-containing protein, partial [Cyclobacteriaceae bacterium]|nr:NosD domain-containing protein [Cyclobacteriaceae bacterium]